MPKNLQEQINEVMDEFDKEFHDLTHVGCQGDFACRTVKNDVKKFITQHLQQISTLTYERIRPEKDIWKRGENLETEQQKGYRDGKNNTISQLDANWNAWKGDV